MFNKKYTVTGVYNYASPSIDKDLINGKRCSTLIASNWGNWMKGRTDQDPAVFALLMFGDDFSPNVYYYLETYCTPSIAEKHADLGSGHKK